MLYFCNPLAITALIIQLQLQRIRLEISSYFYGYSPFHRPVVFTRWLQLCSNLNPKLNCTMTQNWKWVAAV